jgi:hypothetical protein
MNTTMKRERKTTVMAGLGLVFSIVFMSCAGGHVSQNGLFENDHRELKESLLGSWQIMNAEYEIAGQEMYEFYKEDKKVKVKILGVNREMERFDSPDGLTFSFEYKNEEGKTIFVLGQFKSYDREELIAMQELPPSLPGSLSVIRLEKGHKAVTQVVAQRND